MIVCFPLLRPPEMGHALGMSCLDFLAAPKSLKSGVGLKPRRPKIWWFNRFKHLILPKVAIHWEKHPTFQTPNGSGSEFLESRSWSKWKSRMDFLRGSVNIWIIWWLIFQRFIPSCVEAIPPMFHDWIVPLHLLAHQQMTLNIYVCICLDIDPLILFF